MRLFGIIVGHSKLLSQVRFTIHFIFVVVMTDTFCLSIVEFYICRGREMAVARAFSRLSPPNSVLLICDMQEKFR